MKLVLFIGYNFPLYFTLQAEKEPVSETSFHSFIQTMDSTQRKCSYGVTKSPAQSLDHKAKLYPGAIINLKTA